jgi:hypothetical protein
VKTKKIKLVSAGIGASAAIAMSVLGVAFSTIGSAEPGSSGPVPTPQATTGQTVTTTTPPLEPSVSEAKPSVTGPAPLPSEEQGVPG